MNRDRTKICSIISEMLDNPDKHGIYPTSVAYDKLEAYIAQERNQAIGATYAELCLLYHGGHDILRHPVPSIAQRVLCALDKPLAEGE